MKDNKAVTIKGKLYDSVTGMPIKKTNKNTSEITTSKKAPVVTTTRESLTKRSQALYQRASQKTALHSQPLVRKIGRSMDIARSKSISRFSDHKIISQPSKAPVKNATKPDLQPIKHPIVAKVEHIRSLKKQPAQAPETTKTSKNIKEEAIAEALKKASETKEPKKPNFFKRNRKLFNIFSISLILLVAIGYITYLNMPNLSVIIASKQAGINARYPEYQPDGYSINGPISYQNGEVTINFRANTGNNSFVIKQSKSSWDSSAVKNMVDKDSKGEFITTEERGLTIFTYNGNAAWVNGGILYTISGNATLSSDQVRKIATGLCL